MSLTYEDLQTICTIVEETVEPLKSELGALGNDVKDIYEMSAELQKGTTRKDLPEEQSLE